MAGDTLRESSYLPRIYDESLWELLARVPAVEIIGITGSGKTWTALAHARSATYLNDLGVFHVAREDPDVALSGAAPHLVDESHRIPGMRDAVLRQVEDLPHPGRFILTARGFPPEPPEEPASMAVFPMRTMTLFERSLSSGAVSLSALFEGSFTPARTRSGLADVAAAIVHGGWPAAAGATSLASQLLVEGLLHTLLEEDMGRRGLNATFATELVRALALHEGEAVTLRILADAMELPGRGDSRPATLERQISRYLKVLLRQGLLEEVTGWQAPIKSSSRLRLRPRRYLADPSITAALLGADETRLLADGALFSRLFESLCVHDLLVYSSLLPGATTASLHHYADGTGLAVDVVIVLEDHRWAPIEVELGESQLPQAARRLNRLERKVGLNPEAPHPKAEFKAVVTGAGKGARYDEGLDVHVIPITQLGP